MESARNSAFMQKPFLMIEGFLFFFFSKEQVLGDVKYLFLELNNTDYNKLGI